MGQLFSSRIRIEGQWTAWWKEQKRPFWAAFWVLISLQGSLCADFHVTLRTTVDGVPADEMVSWPNVASFLAGGEPLNRYGTRPGSVVADIRCVTTDVGGGLITLHAGAGTDGTYDVYRWQDPYRFVGNEGTFAITRYNIGKIVAITTDVNGRIYAVEETGGTVGARTYRLKFWPDVASFLTYQVATVAGERANVPDLVAMEVIDGQVYGVSPRNVNGSAGYEVRRWSDFAGFLSGTGTVVGARAFNGQIVDVFTDRHVAPETESGMVARRPIWGWLGNKFPTSAPGTPGGFSLEDAFPGLTFQNPIKMLPRPRTASELWVIGREGHVWSFQNRPGVTTKTQVLNITANTMGWGDSGLLGFAFHPEFGQTGSPNRGHVYVAYNFVPDANEGTDGKSCNRLSRFTLADGATTISRSTEFIMINQFDEHDWHNQGDLFFGADGFLYVGMGDEGGLDNAYGNAQKRDGGLFSGVLRLDVNQDPARSHPIRRQPQAGGVVPPGWPATFSQGYGIPRDNPWLDAGGGLLEEFWAIGLRNPYRMSLDSVTGTVFIGDVGQTGMEEINVLTKGANFQWSFKEGTAPGPDAQPSPLVGTNTPPYHAYAQTDGNRCVIGGHVYRGTEHSAALGGQYVFGDYTSGRIWAMQWQGLGTPEVRQVASTTGYTLAGFGLDHRQEIYVMSLNYNGRILKLSTRQAPPPPATLSATGAFEDLTTLKPARGVLPYGVNAHLFSDNAVKQRWISVPNNGAPYAADERVGFQAGSAWSFPVGTVLIKHFALPVNDAIPSLLKRLETRFMVRAADGDWYGVTYKWRDDGRDADLMASGLVENVAITTTGGGVRTQAWTYPSRSDCMQCHNPAAGGALGLRTWQLNGNHAYPGTSTTSNQLQLWSSIGMFDQTLTAAQISGFLKSADLGDESASVEVRVRSYIDSNCAHCHLPGGAQAQIDTRFSTPLAAQNLLNGAVASSLGISGGRVVRPGSLAQSLLHVRMGSLGAEKMPPIAKNVVDTEAVALVARWINNLAVPSTPQSLTAVPIRIGSIDLTWLRGSTNEERFVIRRSTNGTTWTQLGTVSTGVLSYRDDTVAPGVLYFYQVAAANELGASTWTGSVQVTALFTPTTWAAWQVANALGGQNAPLQNPDGDTAANLLEFALGENPASGGAAQDRFRLIANGAGGVHAVLTRPQGLTGVAMQLMVSGALSRSMSWMAAGITPQITSHGDGTESLTFASLERLPALSAGGRGFVRLEVTLQSSGEKAHTAVWFWDRRTFAVGHRSFGPTTLQRERFSGRVTSGSTLLDLSTSVGGVSIRGRLDSSRAAYLEVLDGTHEGHRFEIAHPQTTATNLAINASSPRNTRSTVPNLSGARIVVRNHWTLGELFPSSAWTGATNPTLADKIRFFDSTHNTWQTFWLLNLQGQLRWVLHGDGSLTDQSSTVVPPGAGALVQRVGTDRQQLFFGVLRANAFVLPVQAGTAFLAGGWPMDQSPADRSMLAADGFSGAASSVSADRILLWMPDANPAALPGYQTTFMVSAGTALRFWTLEGSSQLQNLNQSLIFSSHRAFFLRLQAAKPNWRWSMPWKP